MDFTLTDAVSKEDLKSEEFFEILLRSKIEFDNLVNGYRAMHRVAGEERVNHSLTNERRELLRGIRITDKRDRNEKGQELMRWDLVLQYAHKAVQAFNREDIQR